MERKNLAEYDGRAIKLLRWSVPEYQELSPKVGQRLLLSVEQTGNSPYEGVCLLWAVLYNELGEETDRFNMVYVESMIWE